MGLEPLPVEVRFKDVSLSLSYVHAGKIKFGGGLLHRIKQNPEFAGVCGSVADEHEEDVWWPLVVL